ncbi:hypothetical protein BJX61DRAFT_531879 [Aspergillus egyptiacus]|nr:hypothetical protein BJX61DRAFT_531879 [Aspergillus egyptiacus]
MANPVDKPSRADEVMKDASISSPRPGTQELAFDPMDICIPTPPKDQIPESKERLLSAAERISLPWLARSSLHSPERPAPSLSSKSLKRSLAPQPHFRFSPRSQSQARFNGLAIHRVADIQTYRKPTFYNTTSSRYPGLSNYILPSYNNRPNYLSTTQANGLLRLQQKTSRDSSFSSFDTQKSTDESKANSFDSLTTVSTAPSLLPRKRSIDEETQNGEVPKNEPQTEKVQNEDSIVATDAPTEPSPKYRRLTEDGLGIPSGNTEMPKPEQNTALAQPESTVPSLHVSFQSNTLSPDQLLHDAGKCETPIRNDRETQRDDMNTDSHIPGCWPMTPGAAPSEATVPLGPDPDMAVKAEMSGAILPPPSDDSTPLNCVVDKEAQLPANIGDAFINANTAQGGETSSSTWHASLYDSLQRVWTFPKGITQTFVNACRGAVVIVGSIRRALAYWGRPRQERASSPSARHSPVRANIRALPLEQQQRLKANQWRKDRGLPIIEEYPFPELSFDSPHISPTPKLASPLAEAVELNLKASSEIKTTRRISGHGTQPRGSSNYRISKSTPSRHKKTGSGIRKTTGVDSISPQLKGRMNLRPMRRNPERARLERELQHALRTGDFSAFRETTEAATRTRANLRVRFNEPLVTEPIREARPELVPELAPFLRPSLKRPTTVDEDSVEQKENIPSTPTADEEPVPEVTVEEVAELPEPIVDPWLETGEFPLGKPVSAVRLFYPTSEPLPPGRTESIYAAEWRKIEEEKKLSERPTRIRPKGPAVRPLSQKWEERVEGAMRLPGGRKVATTLSGDSLTRKDLATCFTPMAWLNDEVINAYLALIVDYMRRVHGNAGRHDKPRFHAFNSFFFSNLRDKGYESVRRWATRAKIGGEALLNVDTVFVPVHNSAHWTLIVVKPSERTIEHFDSLGSLSHRHVGIVKNWLQGELGQHYVDEEWTVLPSVSSQQDNGSDCGVFLLSNAKAVAIDIEPQSYGASDTRLLRRKIVAELMNGRLEGDFDPTDENGEVLL